MKERLFSAIKVLVMLGVCSIVISIAYACRSHTTTTKEAIASDVPEFLYKTPKEGLPEALEYYNVQFPEIVYAQAILETGHFTSKGCVERNNLFGLYDSRRKEYYKFNHWSESVVAYKKWIQEKYDPSVGYYEFLEELPYATDQQYINKLKQLAKKMLKTEEIERKYPKVDLDAATDALTIASINEDFDVEQFVKHYLKKMRKDE